MVYLYGIIPEMFGLLVKLASNQGSQAIANGIVIAGWVICAAVSYLLGSLNSAIIVSKYKYKQDIRSFGSGNAGLTNMHRVYGKDGAVYTLAGDILKQVVSILFGIILLGQQAAYVAGAFCIIGHIFPVYYNFKGGKGVLTAATMILLIDPMIFAVLLVVFAIVLFITRYVSLSSVIAAITYPAAIYTAASVRTGMPPQPAELVFSLFIGGLIIFMHRSNLYRIFNNEESKFSFHKKKKDGDN